MPVLGESGSGELSAQGKSPVRQTAKHQGSGCPAPGDAGRPVTALQPLHYLPYEPVLPVEVPAPELGEVGVGEVVLLEVPPEAPLELDLLK